MIDEIDGALGDGKGAVEAILKMVIGMDLNYSVVHEVYQWH